jgi:hypothetical protein
VIGTIHIPLIGVRGVMVRATYPVAPPSQFGEEFGGYDL